MMKQKEYLIKVAEKNYKPFLEQGYATAGHNGPHGHLDTPVRNTAHYLIIYSYLFKETGDEKYQRICERFVDYLCQMQSKSQSGAIQCMVSDRFDHLNGLIGQGWVIEGLLYYFEIFGDTRSMDVAKKIYCAQKYDSVSHLWHRIELDGTDIGIDPTYNHQVWFAACSCKLAVYDKTLNVDETIRDFLTAGASRDFRVYSDGMLCHYVNVPDKIMRKIKLKGLIKFCLTPFKAVSPKKFDYRYMEYAYHIFDLYGFCILKEWYEELPIFSSEKYKKAVAFAKNIDYINRRCGVFDAMEKGDMFNVFSYSYNTPTFEYPYISVVCGFENKTLYDDLYEIQRKLMYNKQTEMFTRNNPDIDTWNARTYEIVRYLDKQ